MEEQDEVTKWRQMEERNEVKEMAADAGTECNRGNQKRCKKVDAPSRALQKR